MLVKGFKIKLSRGSNFIESKARTLSGELSYFFEALTTL